MIASGTKLGRYEIRSVIGEGGMGQVYLAHDVKLDRKVALKILPAELASNQDRMRRFTQEAKAAATLNHPNIAHVYEVDEVEGTHFIAMEFIDGVTFRQNIHERPVELKRVLRSLQHVADGLARAHGAGIVHRDLKPDNIMITHDGHVKILDFGLAKLIEPPTQSGTERQKAASDVATALLKQQSTPGTVLGTVGYMSPEQAQGRTQDIDHRSDIFSFGCILYEAVTGRRAFAGKDTIDTLNKVIREEPRPVSEFAPDTPNHLQRIVRRCLAKDREDRYQTIKDVAIELRDLRHDLARDGGLDSTVAPSVTGSTDGSIASTTGGQAASLSSAEYVVSGIRQHKIITAIVLLALIVMVSGVFWYRHAAPTEVTIESIAVFPFQNKSTEPDTEYLADGLTESLIYRLSQLPNLKVSPTSSVFHYKGKEIDPVKAGEELGVNAVLSGRIVQRGENLTISAELTDVRYNKLLWGEQYERKMSELLATQREIAREIVDKLKLKVSGEETGLAKHYTENNEAYQLYLRGRYYWNKRNPESLHKAVDYFQQAIDRDPGFALAYAGMADTYALLGGPEAGGDMSPNETLPKAKAAAIKALELDQSLAEGHVPLAHVKCYYDRDFAGSEREYKRAIELNPNYPVAHHWYAIFLTVLGRYDEALVEIKLAYELDPLSLSINAWTGRILFLKGEIDQSINQLRKTVELDQSFILGHYRLGQSYAEKHMFAEATSEFTQLSRLPNGQPLALIGFAQMYAELGNRSEAEKNLNQLIALSNQQYVSAANIASIFVSLGENNKAFQWLEEANKAHDLNVVRVKHDPRFAGLRSDPRFNDLVRRIGIP
jgi:serine/threonine-protein kinase